MNERWTEAEAAVRDGGMLGSDTARALFDYLRDLELAIRLTMNEPQSVHRWLAVNKVLEAGPKEPE